MSNNDTSGILREVLIAIAATIPALLAIGYGIQRTRVNGDAIEAIIIERTSDRIHREEVEAWRDEINAAIQREGINFEIPEVPAFSRSE